MRPLSINPRCTCRNSCFGDGNKLHGSVKPDVAIKTQKINCQIKADATKIIDVETFQFSSPIATTTSVVINLSDIEDDDDDVKILNY